MQKVRFVHRILSTIALGLVWLLAVPPPPGQAESVAPGTLSLEACYELALTHNESVGIAAAEWRAAEARYGQTRDTLLPAVSLAGSATFQNDRLLAGAERTASRSPESYEARLHAEQELYSGFRSAHTASARKQEERAAQLTERRVRELLFLDVADSFYQCLLFEKDMEVLDKLVVALTDTVDEVAKRIELGRSRRADLLSAQTSLAEARVEQETSKGRRDAARELLSFLIDLPATQLTLADESPFPSDPDVEARLDRVAQRADVLAGEARAEAAQAYLKAAQSDRQPQVNAEGNLYAYENPDEGRDWNIALTFSLPLFDEGVIRARVGEQAQNLEISRLNLESLRRQAASDVRSAYISFMAAAGQRARLREALDIARENYTVQKRDYELGRASQLESFSALAQLLRLKRSEVAAEMQARASLVRLHVAAGEVAP